MTNTQHSTVVSDPTTTQPVAASGLRTMMSLAPSKRPDLIVSPELQFADVDLNEALMAVRKGAALIKFGRKGWPHKRTFQISADESSLIWRSPRKKANATIVLFDNVLRIQGLQTTATFQRHARRALEHLSLSIIYLKDGQDRTLDLIFMNDKQYKLWATALIHFMRRHQHGVAATEIDQEKAYLQRMFNMADSDRSGALHFDEVSTLVKKLNINMSKKYAKKIFSEFDVDSNGTVDFDEFSSFLRRLKERPEVSDLFNSLTKGEEYMSVETLHHFLQTVQKQTDVQLEDVTALMENLPGVHEGKISAPAFAALLSSPSNDVFDPSKLDVYQDMDQPLSHYYIASSHNTYLEGDQLAGRSSVNQYINVLLRGCRCVELDCWDGPDGEPIIFHGHTLTTRIKFQDVIQAVKQYGFQQNPYPIILSLEMHCSLPQQERIAYYLTSILGDSLVTLPSDADKMKSLPSPNALRNKVIVKGKRLTSNEAEEEEELEDDPTNELVPETVTDAVLAKVLEVVTETAAEDLTETVAETVTETAVEAVTETAAATVTDTAADVSENVTDDTVNTIVLQASSTVASTVAQTVVGTVGDETSANITVAEPVPENVQQVVGEVLAETVEAVMAAEHQEIVVSATDAVVESSVDAAVNQEVNRDVNRDVQHKLISQKTSSSRTLSRSASSATEKQHKPKIAQALSDLVYLAGIKFNLDKEAEVWKMSSLTEAKIAKLGMKDGERLSNFHKRHISRIYPLGLRVDSSNYDPCPSWALGAQLVALNYQTSDLGMMYNEGKFLENGGPKGGYVLKPAVTRVDMYSFDPFNGPHLSTKKQLKIQVISAQQLPKPNNASKGEVIDPYVVLSISGVPEDGKTYTTKTIDNNGFNPIWNETFTFVLSMAELDMLTIQVYDKDIMSKDDYIGHYALPVSCIREGYRRIPLLSANMKPNDDYCGLFCHFEFIPL
eukprot:GILK01006318.1.p1 GENE.GILK01006318.1~~GILK01006318.1.p1  ORF type:complete len:964 (+),score=217.74 GILK01006318.1:37-2892(+)